MGRVGRSVSQVSQQMSNAARQIAQGAGQLGQGVRNAAMAMLPLTLGLVGAASQAASFEQQMSAVGAVNQSSAADMLRMSNEAKRMGATTVFTATEAGQAMEFMGRAGANVDQIIGGLAGVMNAAAADGIDLSAATDVIAQTTNIMGREWEQASNTADVLALISARTSTDIRSMGESMSYGGLQARMAGIDFETTTALLGTFSDAGMRGSTAGTALTNALVQLASPSAAGAEHMERLGIAVQSNADGSMDFIGTMDSMINGMSGITNATERVAIANDILGIRGSRAFAAIENAGTDAIRALTEEMRHASDGEGAAHVMAARRLDNFLGRIRLFSSAVEAMSIEVFGPMLAPITEAIGRTATFLSGVAVGVQQLMAAGDDAQARFAALEGLLGSVGEEGSNMALGIVDAIGQVKQMITDTIETVRYWGEQFGLITAGSDMRNITRMIVVFAIVAGAVAPIVLALAGIAFVVTSVIVPAVTGLIAIFSGGASLIAALFSGPALIAIAIAAAAFFAFREEGESIGDTLTRMWDRVVAGALYLWHEVIEPLVDGVIAGWNSCSQYVIQVWDMVGAAVNQAIADISAQFGEATGGMQVDWMQVGQVIGQVIGYVLMVLGGLMTILVRVGGFIVTNLILNFQRVVGLIGALWDGFQALFSGNIVQGLRAIGTALLDFLLEPIRLIVRTLVGLVDGLGQGSLIPGALRSFGTGTLSLGGDTPRIAAAARPAALAGGNAAGGGGPSSAADERAALAGQIAAQRAANGGAAANPNLEATVNIPEQNVNVESSVCVDGQTVARAGERHRVEIGERAGFRATPWARRAQLEQGAAPVRTVT